jgi:hypothetical protein
MDSYALLDMRTWTGERQILFSGSPHVSAGIFLTTKIDLDIHDVAALGGSARGPRSATTKRSPSRGREEPLLDSLEQILDRWIQEHTGLRDLASMQRRPSDRKRRSFSEFSSRTAA